MIQQKKIETPVKCNGGYLDKTGFFAIENLESNKISIVVDWFQVFGTCRNIPEPTQENTTLELGAVCLAYTGHGSELFEYVFDVYREGEKVAVLQVSPRHTLEKDASMLKLENYLLYYDDWLQVFFEIAESLQFSTKNITRLDLAIDGHKGIVAFMNDYLKQTDCKIKMKGKATLKTNFEASTQSFTWFQVGSSQSDKCISIYNKSREIDQSNKIYIKRFWENNEIATDSDVYRVELRLKSKALKDISGFDIKNLADTSYLASLYKTHCENYFEFYHNEDSNSSRCDEIALIDWEQIGAQLLEKISKKPPHDVYKTKMAMHLFVKLHFQEIFGSDFEKENKPLMNKLLEYFDLVDWYNKRLEGWKSKYILPTNKRIIREHLKTELARAGIHPLRANDYLELEGLDLKIDYAVCKKAGFFGDWHKFLVILQQVCNELESRN
jgi:hypothetical protein